MSRCDSEFSTLLANAAIVRAYTASNAANISAGGAA
jgi:hypothetical protein